MPKSILISNASELIRVYTDSIAYIKADGNYSSMFLLDGSEYVFTMNLSSLLENIMHQLDIKEADRFMRIGKSLAINRDYIFAINPMKQKLELADPNLRCKYKIKASKEALKSLKAYIESPINLAQTDSFGL